MTQKYATLPLYPTITRSIPKLSRMLPILVFFTFWGFGMAYGQTNDVGVSQIETAEFGAADFTATTSIEVQVTNYGSADQSNVPISFQLLDRGGNVLSTVNETLTAITNGTTVPYTFTATADLSSIGTYTINAYTGLAGDENAANDLLGKAIHKVSTATLPVEENFEGMGGFTTTYQIDTMDIPGLTGFSYLAEVEGDSRIRFNYNGNSANSGIYSVGFDRSLTGVDVANDFILTIDGSALDTASDVVYLNFSFFDFGDELDAAQDKVFVRGSGSDTWEVLYDWNTGTSTQWEEVEYLNVTEALKTANQQFSGTTQIRWGQQDNVSIPSDGFGIDDVTVFLQPSNDVGIVGYTVPENLSSLTASESVSVNILNFGSVSVSNFDVTAIISNPGGGSTTITENVAGPIAAGDTLLYDFTSNFDFSTQGTYTREVRTEMAGDGWVYNDTISDIKVAHLSAIASVTLPYDQDFEGVVAGTYTTLSGTISGLQGWSFIPEQEGFNRLRTASGEYADGTRSLALDRSAYGSTSKGDAILSLDMSAYDTLDDIVAMTFDFRGFQFQTDLPNNRVFVRGTDTSAWIEVFDWFANKSDLQFETSPVIEITEALRTGSQNFSSSFQIRWGWEEDGVMNNEGLVIDNILVYQKPDDDLSTTVVVSAADTEQPAGVITSDTLSVNVTNLGEATQSNYDVTIRIDGPGGVSTVTETIGGSLAKGQDTTYQFVTTFDFSLAGIYEISAYPALANDSITDNDTSITAVNVLSLYTGALGNVEDFEAINTTFTYTSDAPTMPGAPGFGYLQEFDGLRLKFDIGGIDDDGNRVATMDNPTAGGTQTHYLYHSIDLSAYDTASDILSLTFDVYRHNDENEINDRVWIRGASTEPWVEVYDLSVVPQLTWTEVTLNLRDELIAASQNYSGTFQVRFGHMDDGAYATDGVSFDDIVISEEANTDLELVSVVAPGNRVDISADTLVVTVQNNLILDISGFDVNATIFLNNVEQTTNSVTVPDVVAAGDVAAFTISGFDFSADGNYRVEVSIDATGDGVPDNDDATVFIGNLVARSFPVFEDFEGVGTVNTFVGPDADFGAPYTLPTLTGWSYSPSLANDRLQLSQNSVPAFEGDHAITLDQGNFGENAVIMSVDMSSYDTLVNKNIQLSFWYQDVGDEDGVLDQVYIRGHEDSVWLALFDWNTASSFTWERAKNLDISSVLNAGGQQYTSSFQIKFQQSDNFPLPTDGAMFDNIDLSFKSTTDLAVQSVSAPAPAPAGVLSADTVTVEVLNIGGGAIATYDVEVTVTGPNGGIETITETVSISLDADSTAFVDVVGFDFTKPGDYQVDAAVVVAGDTDSYNNDGETTTWMYDRYTAGLPYIQDFESANQATYQSDAGRIAGIVGEGISYDHEAGGRLQILSGYDDSDALVAALDNTFGNNSNNNLILTLDLSAYDTLNDSDQVNLDFSFYDHFDDVNANDSVWIRGHHDSTWIGLYDLGNNGINDNWNDVADLDILGALRAGGQNYSSTFQIRFGHAGDNIINNDGVSFDDIMVYVAPAIDLEVADVFITNPSPAGVLTSDTVSVIVNNAGLVDVATYTVDLTITRPGGTVDTYSGSSTGSIVVGDADTVFITGLDLTVAGTYELEATVVATGDGDNSNDTGTGEDIINAVYASGLPYFEDFENANTQNIQKSVGFIPSVSGNGFSYVYGNGGRLAIRSDFDPNGSRIASMDNPGGGGLNQLILTLDLSAYTVAGPDYDHLALDFNWYDHGDEGDFRDVVEIRGHHDSAWVEIYDFAANSNNGAWTNVTGIDLYNFLVANGQDYSSTTQIRFQQTDNFPINTDGISIDDVSVYEAIAIDAGVSSMTLSGSRVEVLDDTVRLFITNYGLDTLYSVPAEVEVYSNGVLENTYTATYSADTLDPGETDTLVVTGVALNTDGNYHVIGKTTLAGDGDDSNDASEADLQNFVAVSFPVFEDFESTGTVNTFTGPDATYGAPFTLPTLSGWTYDPSLVNERLQLSQTAVGAFEGDHALALDGGNFGENASILTVDMSGFDVAVDTTIQLSFWFQNVGDENGALDMIYVRGHEDSVWIALYDWNFGNSFVWDRAKNLDVDSALVAGGQQFSSTFQIKFQQSDNFNIATDGVVFDNIDLSLQSATDLAALSATGPSAAPAGILTSDTVKVEVFNYGTSATSSYDVSVTVTGPNGGVTTITETVSLSLPSGELDTVNVVGFDFSLAGNYEIDASVAITGDSDSYNDDAEGTAYMYDRYTAGLPYIQDFESANQVTYQDDAGRISGILGEGISYDHEAGGRLQFLGGYDDTDARVATLDNTFGNNSNNYLVFTADLSAYDTAVEQYIMLDFSFYDHNDEVNANDSVWIRGHYDSSWIGLYDLGNNGVNLAWVDVSALNIQEALKAGGQNYSSTFQIRFGHAGDNIVDNDGLSFDDIMLYEADPFDAGVASISVPDSRVDIVDDTVRLFITNYGLDTLFSVPATVEVYLDGVLDATYTGTYSGDTLMPAETDTLVITGVDFTADGNYTVEAYTTLVNDGDDTNDDATAVSLANLSVAGFPIDESFESVGPIVSYQGEGVNVINGITGWAHFGTLNERVQFSRGNANTGSKSASLDAGNFDENMLVLTVDLSQFDTAASDSIRIDFSIFNSGDENNVEDGIFFRTHEDSAWIDLFDWNDGVTFVWRTISDINLDSALRANDLQFSSTFQVLFQQSDNFAFPTDGVDFDDVKIYATTPTAPSRITLAQKPVRELATATVFAGILSTVDTNPLDTVFNYSLVAGAGDTQNSYFTISNDSLFLTTDADFDYETQKTISIRVQTQDPGGLTFAQAITIALYNSNEAISNLSFASNAVDENVTGVLIGTLDSEDIDEGDEAGYTLVSGTGDTHNSQVYIENDKVYAKGKLDFENGGATRSIRVRAEDNGGLTLDEVFTFTVNDLPEAPTDLALSATSFAEATASGATIATLSTTDQDAGNTFTYSLVPGAGDADNGSFTISGNSLVLNDQFDYENPADRNLTIRLRTTDNTGRSWTEAAALLVTNSNEAPTDITVAKTTFRENTTFSTLLTATDQDATETFTFALVAGTGDTDNGSFTISGHQLSLVGMADFETQNAYSVRVQVTDKGGNTYAEAFAFTVTDVNDDITGMTLSANTIDENAGANVAVGLLTNEHSETDTYVYTLVAGNGSTHNSSFKIENDSVKTKRSFNFEVESALSIRVRVSSSSGQQFERAFAIQVNDANDAPVRVRTISNLFVTQGDTLSRQVISNIFRDEDGDNLTATVTQVGGAALPAYLSFDGGTGLVTASTTADTEADTVAVNVSVSDGSGTATGTFTVIVLPATAGAEEGPDVTGLGDLARYIALYPNPTEGRVRLHVENDVWQGMSLKVTTIQGVVLEETVMRNADHVVDLTDFASGMYLITITREDQTHIARIVKK